MPPPDDRSEPRITFSRNCRSGLLREGEVCNCRRCRQERNEPVTAESEAQAARESGKARERLEQQTQAFLAARRPPESRSQP